MPKNKIGLQFKGFEEVLSSYEKAGGDLKKAVEEALIASKQVVNPEAKAAIQRHRRTGKTEESLDKTMKVEWDGFTASIDVGFHISEGGLPSIFLMYGTPRMAPDKKLYNSIYGTRVKKKVAEIQQEAVNKVIKETIGG